VALPLKATPPDIIWIVIEDASPHLGCYGETAVRTPVIDRMALNGIRCTSAFVTAPVCSPSRSAMVSGMYQMTLGVHNHRSQVASGKGSGNQRYYDSYQVPGSIRLVPQLFADAGYHVTNRGKTDYNFLTAKPIYHGNDWKQARADQPIFAQFQLKGGKNRRAPRRADPATVTLPPYYPDHPVMRRDWADYLDSWVSTDQEVGRILADLKMAGRLEKAAVFLWTDHGISHLRGKQFLYEEGIHVPLIIQLPDGARAGTTREDLIEHIDIAATSLALAEIPIPDYVQGHDLLAADHVPRQYLFTGRDRCDETVDIIRATRNGRYKYIRNFMSHIPHAQPSQYKDGKQIMQTMRELHATGRLNKVQARLFAPRRPPEELYDLQNDPHELVNLATSARHAEQLATMRDVLYSHMVDERDMGLVPEPILEEEGRQSGSKYDAFQSGGRDEQTRQLIAVISAGEAGDSAALLASAASADPSIRYWAAVWLGEHRRGADVLKKLCRDEIAAVRVAAAQALFKLGDKSQLTRLVNHIDDPNLLVGMFALRAIEELGDAGRIQQARIAAAQKSPYEFSRRIARRLTSRWD